jgi:hypothetical protein
VQKKTNTKRKKKRRERGEGRRERDREKYSTDRHLFPPGYSLIETLLPSLVISVSFSFP